LSPFVDLRGCPVAQIANDSQLRRFLGKDWLEKSKVVAGSPGLSIEHGTSLWHLNLKTNKKRHHRTLGKYPDVSIAQARQLALEMRDALEKGVDVRDGRRATPGYPQLPRSAPTPVVKTPKEETPRKKCVNDFIDEYFRYRLETLKTKKTNKAPVKTVSRMQHQYDTYIRPVIGELEPKKIANRHVVRILSAITDSDTTRRKTKSVLSLLLQWFVSQGHIDIDKLNINWKLVATSLPACTSVERSFPRMGIDDIPRFVALAMKPQETHLATMTAIATVLVILTAQRVGNFLELDAQMHGEGADWFAKWRNVDLEKRIWTIPPECLKISRVGANKLSQPLRIPLATHTVDLLVKIRDYWENRGIKLKPNDFVIPHCLHPERPHKSNSIRFFIQEMHAKDMQEGGPGFFDPDQPGRVATTHGFRSAFQDWCLTHGYPMLYTEKALAHEDGGKVQKAYQRSDFVEERRPMMQAWADYCFSMVKTND